MLFYTNKGGGGGGLNMVKLKKVWIGRVSWVTRERPVSKY